MLVVKNIHTGEIRKFRNLAKAARELFVSYRAVISLRDGDSKLLGGRWKKHNYPLTKPHRRKMLN